MFFDEFKFPQFTAHSNAILQTKEEKKIYKKDKKERRKTRRKKRIKNDFLNRMENLNENHFELCNRMEQFSFFVLRLFSHLLILLLFSVLLFVPICHLQCILK